MISNSSHPFALWLAWAALSALAGTARAQQTERVSVDSAGAEGNRVSQNPSLSADGRLVAFWSDASNLAAGDTNQCRDVFVHDRQTGQTTRVSVSSTGAQANGPCQNPSLSADGRFVAFWGFASNLVPGDSNGVRDVFVHDRNTGQTTRVSVNSRGGQADEESRYPSISGDGRFIAFESRASNLVPGDLNQKRDVFLHDRQTGHTTRVSVSSTGAEGDAESRYPAISADGRYVSFASHATNLVPNDTNQEYDIFVHDRLTGETTRVNLSSAGTEANGTSRYPSISGDGRYVCYVSMASNLVPNDRNAASDVFLHDRQTGRTVLVSRNSAGIQANDSCLYPVVSADGRFVAYYSDATNLVPGDLNHARDIFFFERASGRTTLRSISSAGVQANDGCYLPVLSADGHCVAFDSVASNLVAGDANATGDVFVQEQGIIGPNLTRGGDCPGTETLSVTAATAGGMVAILYGAAGSFSKPNAPCQGLLLGIASPGLGALATADAAGALTLTFIASAARCGLRVQAVDLATCLPSGEIVL